MKNNRVQALKWWSSIDGKSKVDAINKWKESPGKDSKKEWPVELIAMSSSTIEIIWNDLFNENKK